MIEKVYDRSARSKWMKGGVRKVVRKRLKKKRRKFVGVKVKLNYIHS